ncbi:hypothetical protein [Amycolatopsis sp. NPDC021455]|uniref:hypothetical protein n=1 Tax=Amycolatopsis sp. NPDC021455 TaxID=3154901 RepID=UPI0033C8FC17
MTNNQKQRKNGKKTTKSSPPEQASGGRKWLVGVLATAVAALLVAWLTPLPAYIKDKFFPDDPIDVAVQQDITSCTPFGITKPLDKVTPPPAEGGDLVAWSHANDLAELGWTKVLVNVSGKSDKTVTITGIKFTVTERKPPLTGPSISKDCGGETTGRFVVVDLDQSPPKIIQSTSIPRTWGDDDWRTTELKFPYKVTDKETEPLLIIAKTEKCECRWSAQVSWSFGDRSGSKAIDYQGQPFHTSAEPGRYDSHWYDDSKHQWVSLG